MGWCSSPAEAARSADRSCPAVPIDRVSSCAAAPATIASPAGYSQSMAERLRQVPNVRYLGHVSPARAIEVIAGASLLLSTSEGEGFPSVFLEAWASGTPVVSLKIDPDDAIANSEPRGHVCRRRRGSRRYRNLDGLLRETSGRSPSAPAGMCRHSTLRPPPSPPSNAP